MPRNNRKQNILLYEQLIIRITHLCVTLLAITVLVNAIATKNIGFVIISAAVLAVESELKKPAEKNIVAQLRQLKMQELEDSLRETSDKKSYPLHISAEELPCFKESIVSIFDDCLKNKHMNLFDYEEMRKDITTAIESIVYFHQLTDPESENPITERTFECNILPVLDKILFNALRKEHLHVNLEEDDLKKVNNAIRETFDKWELIDRT